MEHVKLGSWGLASDHDGHGYATQWVWQYALRFPAGQFAVVGVDSTHAHRMAAEVMEASPEDYRPKQRKVDRLLVYPNGAQVAILAARLEMFKGPQFHGAWLDRPCEWKDPEVWTAFALCLRLGPAPAALITQPGLGRQGLWGRVEARAWLDPVGGRC